jgi:hypothetical protein
MLNLIFAEVLSPIITISCYMSKRNKITRFEWNTNSEKGLHASTIKSARKHDHIITKIKSVWITALYTQLDISSLCISIVRNSG